MTRRIERVSIPGAAGPLEGLLMIPERPRSAAALLCHPHPRHGGTMHTKALFAAARALADLGLPVLRFHFRGVGGSAGSWSGGDGEKEDARRALEWLVRRCPRTPLLMGGMSFGAWIGLEIGATSEAVRALLGIAPPLSSVDFRVVLQQLRKPLLLVAGDADPVCPLGDLLRLERHLGPKARIAVLPGARHLLTTRLPELRREVQRFSSECFGLDASA